jgi:short-subunit dehydrogenase
LSLSNPTNLITGATGFIGSYVASRLPNVRAVKREEYDDPNLDGDNLLCLHGAAAMSPFMLQSPDVERKIFEANYFSVTKIVRNVARKMIGRGYGKIILTSSAVTDQPVESEATYGASKAALNYFYGCLCKELAPLGIEAHLLIIGPIEDSPMIRGIKLDDCLTKKMLKVDDVWQIIKEII